MCKSLLYTLCVKSLWACSLIFPPWQRRWFTFEGIEIAVKLHVELKLSWILCPPLPITIKIISCRLLYSLHGKVLLINITFRSRPYFFTIPTVDGGTGNGRGKCHNRSSIARQDRRALHEVVNSHNLTDFPTYS